MFKSTQKVFGVIADSKKYSFCLWSITERQRVEEMFGSPGVVMPYGTETLRITLNTLASDRRASWFFGTALT